MLMFTQTEYGSDVYGHGEVAAAYFVVRASSKTDCEYGHITSRRRGFRIY